MIGKTNAQSKNSGTAYEFECTTSMPNNNLYNTNIPIEGVSKIVLQYNGFRPDGSSLYYAIAELDTVTDGVLSKVYAIGGSAGGMDFATSLKVVDGMIHFGAIYAPPYATSMLAHVSMIIY